MEWDVLVHPAVEEWIQGLDEPSQTQLVAATRLLRAEGPALGRPLVDSIKWSSFHNMKELRPGSRGRTEPRVLFVFDTHRKAILLVGGDKHNKWSEWYKKAIPLAEERYHDYQKGYR